MAKLNIETIKEPNKIMNYWKKEKLVVTYIVIFGMLSNITIILGPVYQGRLIDSIAQKNSLKSITMIAIIYVTFIASTQVFRYFKRFYIRRFANVTNSTMRLIIYNNIIYKSIYEINNEKIGDVMTRIISDVDLCVEGMRKFTTEIFDTVVLILSYLVSMLIFDIKITVISIVFVPVSMGSARKLKGIIYKYSKDYRNKSSEVAEITYDTIENSMLYRVTGMEEKSSIKYNEELKSLYEKAIKANILENSMQPIYNFISMLGVIIVIYLGGTKVIDGIWTIGMFSTYLAMFTAVAFKSSKVSKLFNSVQKSKVSWNRIKPYLVEYKSPNSILDINNNDTKLSVENLSFSYGNNVNVIENISFEATKGEIIGITGSVASGKSTLGIALLGMYPYLGSIKIDGKELKNYSEHERSKMISYLGHRAELFSDTIYNNISLGDNKDINSALKDVCFDIDLKKMPKGKDTLVGNSGIKLSGGQQSRIALARALINKNKIIILDDPFSAVDMKTEAMIIEKIKYNYKNSIIILISHRLAIFDRVDKIILLKDDKSAEVGTHKEFIKKSLIYSSIYNLQNIGGKGDE